VRRLVMLLMLAAGPVVLAAAHAGAQTPEVAAGTKVTPPRVAVAAKKPAPAKVKPKKKTPVVAAHGGAVKKPVHPAAPVSAPPVKPAPAPAKGKPAPPPKPKLPADVGPVTGLHIPRYVTLKTDDVNMRKGPAMRFPISWTYKRVGLPIRIVGEWDVWRAVEDIDGEKGWVNQATLSGRRGFLITGDTPRQLRVSASEDADSVAILKPGVVGRLRGCAAGAAWCEVEVAGYHGWLKRDWFWGSDPGEAVQP